MHTGEDRIVLPAVDTSVALVPQRVISAERLGLKQAERRARRAREESARLVGERTVDRRIIAALEGSVRGWAAAHAASEARLRRWQLAFAVLLVLALGYVLVYTHIGY
jgi:hypothetical protein